MANQEKRLKFMQIETIHQWQYALDSAVKVLRFCWRHAFVLGMIWMLVDIIAEGKTPIIEREIFVFTIAAFIDWFKMKWKLDSGQNSYHQSSSITAFTQQNYWNAEIVGTPAYLSNLGHRY